VRGGGGEWTSKKTKNAKGRKSNPNRKANSNINKRNTNLKKKSINEMKYCGI